MSSPTRSSIPVSSHAGGSIRDDGPVLIAILQLADRIRGVLADESAHLRGDRQSDFDAIVARKSHLVVELSRLVKHIGGPLASTRARDCLTALSRDLAENANLLRRHMEAVHEISSILAAALNSASEDGTYSPDAARRKATSW